MNTYNFQIHSKAMQDLRTKKTHKFYNYINKKGKILNKLIQTKQPIQKTIRIFKLFKKLSWKNIDIFKFCRKQF